MAESTAEVRRDIELTRERMSTTLAQLEEKLNVMQVVKDNPWPALVLAVGAGVALGSSGADVKAAAATAVATKGASSKVGTLLDDLVAQLMTGVTAALQDRVEHTVGEIKRAIGAPVQSSGTAGTASTPYFADRTDGASAASNTGYGVGPVHGTPGSAPGTVSGLQPRAD